MGDHPEAKPCPKCNVPKKATKCTQCDGKGVIAVTAGTTNSKGSADGNVTVTNENAEAPEVPDKVPILGKSTDGTGNDTTGETSALALKKEEERKRAAEEALKKEEAQRKKEEAAEAQRKKEKAAEAQRKKEEELKNPPIVVPQTKTLTLKMKKIHWSGVFNGKKAARSIWKHITFGHLFTEPGVLDKTDYVKVEKRDGTQRDDTRDNSTKVKLRNFTRRFSEKRKGKKRKGTTDTGPSSEDKPHSTNFLTTKRSKNIRMGLAGLKKLKWGKVGQDWKTEVFIQKNNRANADDWKLGGESVPCKRGV